MLHSHLLSDTVQLAADNQILILNSAADPFVPVAAQRLSAGTITLAEDNIAALQGYQDITCPPGRESHPGDGYPVPQTGLHEGKGKPHPHGDRKGYTQHPVWGTGIPRLRPGTTPPPSPLLYDGYAVPGYRWVPSPHGDRKGPPGTTPPPSPLLYDGYAVPGYRWVPYHQYISRYPSATMDVAVMDLLYQAGNAWVMYGLQVAAYALKAGGRLYVVGAKDRGVLSVAKRMQAQFGNVETLAISKGQRVVCSIQPQQNVVSSLADASSLISAVFASGKLDEGTRLLLGALEVHVTDDALDIGCGAGFIGMHIAGLANKGSVTMVDASLAAVDAAQGMIEQSGLTNIRVLASNGAQAVLSERFDLVVTNPPFHLGGMQTTETAERFIREAAQVLRRRGRFYVVANRFLKYEPVMRGCFGTVEEVDGNTRYKVLRCTRF